MASATLLWASSPKWDVSPKSKMAKLKTENKRETNIDNIINNI
jgi:hypothetical protein